MKQFLGVVLMTIMMSVLVACSENQDGNPNNTDMPSISHSEDENLEKNTQSSENEDDTVDSTDDINRSETYWISGSAVNFRKALL